MHMHILRIIFCRLRTDNRFTKNNSVLSNSPISGQNKLRDIPHFWRWYV